MHVRICLVYSESCASLSSSVCSGFTPVRPTRPRHMPDVPFVPSHSIAHRITSHRILIHDSYNGRVYLLLLLPFIHDTKLKPKREQSGTLDVSSYSLKAKTPLQTLPMNKDRERDLNLATMNIPASSQTCISAMHSSRCDSMSVGRDATAIEYD